tara:strand:+ start:84 stop:620 length:537 start_codon:yes stop_codon:yes gene_type:complete
MYKAIIKLKDKKIKTDLKDFSSLETINEINNKSKFHSRRDEYDGEDYYDDEEDYYTTSLKGLFKKNKEIKIKLKKDLNGEYEAIIKVLGKKIKLDLIELPTIYTFEPISKYSEEFYDYCGVEDHLISYQTNVNSFLKDNEEMTITIFKRYKYYYYEGGRVMVKDKPLPKTPKIFENNN